MNESGLAIFGDDFASRHAFDEEGSRVVYLVTDGAGATPYLSPYLRARDTTTGVLLWSIELDRPATELWWSGDRIMAAIGNDDGTDQTTAVVVLDATTGAVVSTVPTMLEITHID